MTVCPDEMTGFNGRSGKPADPLIFLVSLIPPYLDDIGYYSQYIKSSF
jgi:hypothetical protein